MGMKKLFLNLGKVLKNSNQSHYGSVICLCFQTTEVFIRSDEPKFPHECAHCNKSFKKPSDLVRHVRIHTGEKPYSCDLCGRSFTVKSTLDSHMKTHGTGQFTALL